MKKIIKKIVRIIFAVGVAVLLLIGLLIVGTVVIEEIRCRRTDGQEIKEIEYTEDYTKIYENEIIGIFGEDCVIGERERIIDEGESCDCGYHADTHIYYQWDIFYKDELGQEYCQQLNNKDNFEIQQISWLARQIEEHYIVQYFSDYFDMTTLEGKDVEKCGRGYAYAEFGNPIMGYATEEEEKRWLEAEDLYEEYYDELLSDLRSGKKQIHLYKLDYSEVYQEYPIMVYMSINAYLPENKHIHDYEAECETKIKQILLEISEESAQSCNMEVRLHIYDKKDDNTFMLGSYLLSGEYLSEINEDFGELVYEIYKKNIW